MAENNTERVNVNDLLIKLRLVREDSTQKDKEKQMRWFLTNFKKLSSFEKVNGTTFFIDLFEFEVAYDLYRKKRSVILEEQKGRMNKINDKRRASK